MESNRIESGASSAAFFWIPGSALVVVVALAFALGDSKAMVGALVGGVTGLLIQGAALVMMSRRLHDSDALFMGAFARASAVRVFGGALAVLLALTLLRLPPGAFLAGFGVEYVIVEVLTDIRLVKALGRTGGAR